MATEQKIRERIAEIISRRNNVTLNEIEWVMNQLASYVDVGERQTTHTKLFRVGKERFAVNCHNPGNKQVKPYSVDEFAKAMIKIGWYDE